MKPNLRQLALIAALAASTSCVESKVDTCNESSSKQVVDSLVTEVQNWVNSKYDKKDTAHVSAFVSSGNVQCFENRIVQLPGFEIERKVDIYDGRWVYRLIRRPIEPTSK